MVFGPAASLAGNLLPLAVLIAALVAYLNAMSISQLASALPRSGGAYSYARHYLSSHLGFLAGTAFLVGKIGSVAAIALTFATYLTPDSRNLTAVLAIVTMTLLNVLGVQRTALGARILASVTIGFLLAVLAMATFSPIESSSPASFEPVGVLSAAALIFFAFAGYARVATLGDEVEKSQIAIPRAIRLSLTIVVLLYLGLAIVLNAKLGPKLLGTETAVNDLVEQVAPRFSSWVWLFTAIAALGSLLVLLAGMGRTAATMAIDQELPAWLALRNRFDAPWLAELSIGLIGAMLVLSANFEFLIGLSSFAVLTYYAIANLAAYKQPASESSRPKWLNLLGLASCLSLALAVPFYSLMVGFTVLAGLVALRWALAKRKKAR